MAEGNETPTAAGDASGSTSGNGGALPPAVKIDVTEIATPFRAEVRRAIQERYGGVGPKLVAFLANTVRAFCAWWLASNWAVGCEPSRTTRQLTPHMPPRPIMPDRPTHTI